MHVLYVMGQNAGGLPHYTAELANEVANHAEVTVLKPSETTADGLFAEEVTVRDAFSPLELSMPKIYRRDIDPLDVARGIRSYDNLKRVRETDADIVHDTTDLFPQVKLFMKRHRIDEFRPLVVTRHEVEMTRFTPARPHHLAEEFVNYVLPDLRIDRVIVHTENQKRALLQRGESPEDVEVIPHGTYSIFGDHEDVETEPEENCLLFFGNVVPHKGLDTLVRAVPLVRREVPDVRLIIAGRRRRDRPETSPCRRSWRP